MQTLKTAKFLLMLLLAVLMVAGSASALTLGTNITVWDGRGYTGSGRGGEDQETEPGMINNQNWDLEGFFVSGNTLQVVSGFNLKNGFMYGGHRYTAGDIFIDIDGDAQYGEGQDLSIKNFGYEYALDIDWSSESKTFAIIKLPTGWMNYATSSEALNTPESDPFRYISGGTQIATGNIVFSGYDSALTDHDVPFVGGDHYAAEFDLTDLGQYMANNGIVPTEFTFHMTLSCGNDNLIGKASVPEPAPMFLFGSSLLGIAAIGGKRFFRK